MFRRKKEPVMPEMKDAALQIRREVAVAKIVEQWRGRTVLHPTLGEFRIPDVEPNGITMQLIRLAVDTVADAIETQPVKVIVEDTAAQAEQGQS